MLRLAALVASQRFEDVHGLLLVHLAGSQHGVGEELGVSRALVDGVDVMLGLEADGVVRGLVLLIVVVWSW